jgi:hypothetical protein
MKRLFVCLFVFGICAGTVVNAQQVSAPATVLVEDHHPAKGSLKAYVPAVEENPIQKMVRVAREMVIRDADSQGLCDEWAGLAFDVGWPIEEIPRLLRIIHRESRCLPQACSTPDRPDLRRCRDWGLTQINDYSWKRTVRSQGMEMSDMWLPDKNLSFALWLFRYSEASTGCGWTPWAGSC